jgi:MFS family permease
VDRTRQLLAVSGGTTLLAAVFGLLVAPSGIQMWQVVLFAFAAGCFNVFDTPARQALVLDVVPRDSAPRALAFNALGGILISALGAFAAGMLIPTSGVQGCYVVVAICNGIGVLLVGTLRVAQAHRDSVAPPFGHAIREAVRLIVDAPMVGILVAAGIACEVFAFSFGTALPLYAQNVLLAGPEGLGTLNAANNIGGALAVMLLTLMPLRIRREPLLSTIFVVFGLSMIVLALTRELSAAAAVLLVTGFCAAGFDVLLQMLIQLAVPDKQRGRAVGIWVFAIGSGPVGHLEMGALGGAFGAPFALAVNGALTVLAALILMTRGKEFQFRLSP